MLTLFIALRAILFAAAFLLFWLWVALRVQALDRYLGTPLPRWSALLGVLSILAGGSFVLTCIALLTVQGRGPPAPF
jgi:hypothetical protein